jgi:hypothetical protein
MLRKYLAALWADWVARMSGAASVLLAFLAAYLEFVIKNGKAALWVTAAVCFIIASYRIWAAEHKKASEATAQLEATVVSKEISDELLRLWFVGEQLFDELNELVLKTLPTERVEQWIQEVEAFLLAKFPAPKNELYVKMFREDAQVSRPMGVFGEQPQAKLQYKVRSHKHQLGVIHHLASLGHLGRFK